MEEILDLVIIGAGPAGITAGVYAARTWLNFKIVDKLGPGGQIVKTDLIDNYPGFPKIKGFELALKFQEHLNNLGSKIEYEEVIKVEKLDNGNFKIYFKSGKIYIAKKIILATGVNPRMLGLLNEEKYTGRGISYCSTCDGYFYKDKIVAVVGSGLSAQSSTQYLSKIAKKVYLINRNNYFKEENKILEEIENAENVEIIFNTNITKLTGEDKLEEITIENSLNSEEKKLNIDGLFILIGNIPNSDLVIDLVETSENKEIIVNENFETKTEGLYAVGDVTRKIERQILTAMSDAVIAIKDIEKNI